MERLIELLRRFTEEMNATNSLLDKKVVLKKHPEMKTILGYVYGPKKFNVSSANVEKNKELRDPYCPHSLYELLDSLANREYTGNDAIGVINTYIDEEGEEYRSLIYKVLDKDLEIRVGASVINDVYPDCVQTFDVALANKLEDVKGKVDIFDGTWFASRKLDGVRCLTLIDEKGDISFFSREGKAFENFGVVEKELKKLDLRNVVLDGEMSIVNEDGSEDFKAITKVMRKKDFEIPNPKYFVFDMLDLASFYAKSSKEKFSTRYQLLQKTIPASMTHVSVLSQEIVTESQYEELLEDVEKFGWEGLILRKDAPYKGKRSNDLLKVKKFQTEEFIVKRVEVGPFRVIENGKEATIETLTNVIIDYKGGEVSVGSGFNFEERAEFYKDPTKIIGKKITVKYFEETSDSTGKKSLRFPIFQGIRDYE